MPDTNSSEYEKCCEQSQECQQHKFFYCLKRIFKFFACPIVWFYKLQPIEKFTAFLSAIAFLQTCAFIQSERAFVVNNKFELSRATIGNRPNVKIAPIWMNVGDTPTRDMTIYTSDIDEVCDFTISPQVKFTPLDLGPKMTATGAINFLDMQKIPDIMSWKKAYCVWGEAKYRDIFYPLTREHITRYCYIIDSAYGDFGNNSNQTGILETSLCGTHNCADEECDRQDKAAEQNASPP